MNFPIFSRAARRVPRTMKNLFNVLLMAFFVSLAAGCGDEGGSGDLPPPDKQPGGGSVASDEQIKQERDKIEQMLKNPKKAGQQ